MANSGVSYGAGSGHEGRVPRWCSSSRKRPASTRALYSSIGPYSYGFSVFIALEGLLPAEPWCRAIPFDTASTVAIRRTQLVRKARVAGGVDAPARRGNAQRTGEP